MQDGIPSAPDRRAVLPYHPTALIAAMAVIAATPVLVLLVLLSSGWLPLRTVDTTVVRSLNTYISARPLQLGVWRLLSTLFGPVVLPVAVLAAAVTLWLRGSKRNAVLIAVATIGASLLSSVVKVLVARPRPVPPNPVDHAAGYSFPSGHTLSSMVVIGVALVVLLPGVSARWKVLLVASGALLAAAVGFSRLVLGVHYFSDVLGSWLIGGAWLLVLIAGFGRVPPTPRHGVGERHPTVRRHSWSIPGK